MADEKEALLFLKGGEKLYLKTEKKQSIISLLAVEKNVEGLNVKGTHWELQNAKLQYNYPYAVSNRWGKNSKEITISCSKGYLAVYLLLDDCL